MHSKRGQSHRVDSPHLGFDPHPREEYVPYGLSVDLRNQRYQHHILAPQPIDKPGFIRLPKGGLKNQTNRRLILNTFRTNHRIDHFPLAATCTMCHSTLMIPFRLQPEPGIPIYEQVVFAAKKAIASGQMTPGETFPSVRTLSRELKINPNTAHKVVGELVQQGLLEVRPGLGTVVAERAVVSYRPETAPARRVEELVLAAQEAGMTLRQLKDLIEERWREIHQGATKR